MNEKCEMEMKMGIGPNLKESGSKKWALRDENQCTKMYNISEIDSKRVSPRSNEWACPDEDPLTEPGYEIFGDISDLKEFVSFFEKKNAEIIEEVLKFDDKKRIDYTNVSFCPELTCAGYGVFDDIDELREFVDFFEMNNAQAIAYILGSEKSHGSTQLNAPIIGGL